VFEFALFLVFPAAMAFAAAMDFFTMTIPNRISLALLAAFFLALPFTEMTWLDVASHIAAGLLILVVGIGMFARGWIGGGDAKLAAVAALWLGFDQLFVYLIMASFVGGLLASTLLFFRSLALPVWLYQQEWAMRLHNRKGGIPYGIALAAAGLWVYPSTLWFSSLAV
jgi:prepilin peptidase CpaA